MLAKSLTAWNRRYLRLIFIFSCNSIWRCTTSHRHMWHLLFYGFKPFVSITSHLHRCHSSAHRRLTTYNRLLLLTWTCCFSCSIVLILFMGSLALLIVLQISVRSLDPLILTIWRSCHFVNSTTYFFTLLLCCLFSSRLFRSILLANWISIVCWCQLLNRLRSATYH